MNKAATPEPSSKVLNLALYGILIALVYISTMLMPIPMPFSNGGLVHIGDVMLLTAALTFGAKKGAAAGGLGMMLFDLFSPYAVWAPYTLVIRALMGFTVGYIAFSDGKKGTDKLRNILAVTASLPILILGYYAAEGFIYGNWITPVKSIPGNLMQFVVGIICAVPLTMVLNRVPLVKRLKNL